MLCLVRTFVLLVAFTAAPGIIIAATSNYRPHPRRIPLAFAGGEMTPPSKNANELANKIVLRGKMLTTAAAALATSLVLTPLPFALAEPDLTQGVAIFKAECAGCHAGG